MTCTWYYTHQLVQYSHFHYYNLIKHIPCYYEGILHNLRTFPFIGLGEGRGNLASLTQSIISRHVQVVLRWPWMYVLIIPLHAAEWMRAWQRSDHPSWTVCPFLSLHTYTTWLLWRHPTHCSHAFSLKSIGEIRTQCGITMMSFSCNWDNLSKVKVTILFCRVLIHLGLSEGRNVWDVWNVLNLMGAHVWNCVFLHNAHDSWHAHGPTLSS